MNTVNNSFSDEMSSPDQMKKCLEARMEQLAKEDICLAFSGGRWYHLNEKKLIGDALWSCCTYIKIHGPPWEPRP